MTSQGFPAFGRVHVCERARVVALLPLGYARCDELLK